MEVLEGKDHERTRLAGSPVDVCGRVSANARERRFEVRLRILVINPDLRIRNIIAGTLGWTQWLTTWTTDGALGWEELRTQRYDLVIMAQELPKLSGLDLLRRMRTHTLYIPVVLMFRAPVPCEPSELRLLLKPGATLNNPLSSASLLTKVHYALSPPLPEAKARAGGPPSAALGAFHSPL